MYDVEDLYLSLELKLLFLFKEVFEFNIKSNTIVKIEIRFFEDSHTY